MTGDRGTGLWTLPGPRRFLDDLLDTVGSHHGVVSLRLPLAWPGGLLEAAAGALRAGVGARVQLADAGTGLGPRGPVHWLAARAAAGATGIRTVPDFLDDPGLADTVFIVHGSPRSDWRTWANFLRLVTAERARRERLSAPVVVFVTNPAVSPSETRAIFGTSELRWLGRIGRLDTELMVERALGNRPDDGNLVSRTVASCIAEVAGWDPRTVTLLAGLPLQQAINPIDFLEQQAAGTEGSAPTWHQGLVDLWDGMPFEHSSSLLKRGRKRDVVRRVWRAHVKAIFPFLDRVRLAVTRRYRAELLDDGAYTDRDGHRFEDPDDFEFGQIHHRLRSRIPPADASFLYLCHRTRNNLAHLAPADPQWIIGISTHWDSRQHRFIEESHGWDWPRCGQKLVVLVGSPGPARTAWASAHFSADDILTCRPSPQKPPGADEALWRVREEAMRRLAEGRSVVIDALHDDPARHLAFAVSAAVGIRTEFVGMDGTAVKFDGREMPAGLGAPGSVKIAAE